jgi:CheY-like chemotaxis protein
MPATETLAVHHLVAEGEEKETAFADTFHLDHFLQNLSTIAPSETGVFSAVAVKAEANDRLADHQDAPHQQEETHLPETVASHQKGPNPDMNHVLIVEDTVELAEVMQATLERMGLKAEIATNGKSGMKLLKTANPGLLLMDLGLPDTSGWKMLEDIKAHYASLNRPMPKIIIVTAYDDAPNRVIGKLQNIHSYLIKPVTPAQVEQTVADVLGV